MTRRSHLNNLAKSPFRWSSSSTSLISNNNRWATTTCEHDAFMPTTTTRLWRSSTAAAAASSSLVTDFSSQHDLMTPTKRIINNPIRVRHGLDQGCIDYTTGWAWQQCLLQRRLLASRQRRQQQQQVNSSHHHPHDDDDYDDQDVILLFQHYPVYTLGRGAKEEHVTFLQTNQQHHDETMVVQKMLQMLSRRNKGPGSARLALDQTSMVKLQHLLEQQQYDSTINDRYIVHSILEHLWLVQRQQQQHFVVVAPNGAPVYRVERGGEVTFHGPGQLVVYPILNLQRPPFQPDLHWFLHQLEQVLITTLQHYEIASATRDPINTGVWVGRNKIAAIGVTASRWITTHGFCLNIRPELHYFDPSVIRPCGVEAAARGVTSMAEILQQRGRPVPSVADVARVVLESMERVFQVPLREMESL